MEHGQLGLQRCTADGRGSVFPHDDKVVFAFHACHNRGFIQQRRYGQGRGTSVLKRLARLENRLATRNAWTLHDVLVGATNGLDFEPTRHELHGRTTLIGDADVMVVRFGEKCKIFDAFCCFLGYSAVQMASK